MSRRRKTHQRPLEVLAEHPPEQCRKVMSARVLKLIARIDRTKAQPEVTKK